MRRLSLLLIPVLLTASAPRAAEAPSPSLILKHIRLLNQIPEEQLDEKRDPAFSIIRSLYDVDGPDFLELRKLVGQATIRQTMTPSTKSVVAGILSNRWDSFTLAGNLWLASLGSPNQDIRNKARKKLVQFIQPAHVPALIEMLAIPKSNIQVYQVLWEVTGQKLDPNVKTWRAWWVKGQKWVDIIGHLLKTTKEGIVQKPIGAFDQPRFWYIPEALSDASTPYAQRSPKEQMMVTQWNNWASQEVRRFVESWRQVKPVVDRITHQPDPRVNRFLEALSKHAGYGDYASVVLAWRSNAASLPVLQESYSHYPTVSRALARGTLGDKNALKDLLQMIEDQPHPLSFSIMDDDARASMGTLRTLGIIPAEQAFELLVHQVFDFDGASTRSEKKKAIQKARKWLHKNFDDLTLDRRRGYYVVSK